MLQWWGESSIKQFLADAVTGSLKLESALAKLRVSSRVVLDIPPYRIVGVVRDERWGQHSAEML